MHYLIALLVMISVCILICLGTFKDHKKIAVTICVILTLFSMATALYNFYIPFMILLVLWGLYVIFEIILRLTHKIDRLRFLPFILAVLLTTGYFAYCYHVGKDVKVTRYDVDLGAELKIAQISDTHMGLFFTPEELEKAVELINENDPDIVVITGDFVDEKTSDKTFYEACEVLSHLKSKYGTYYITGNHDGRRIPTTKLLSELKRNNVTPLIDEAVEIGDDFVLVGRRDEDYNYEMPRRSSVKKILSLSGLASTDRKVILLDHKPQITEYFASRNEAHIDLMISGHTHGGQIFPANLLFMATDEDPLYGLSQRGGIWFLVSSGTSSGMVPFKSAAVSEVVILNVY